MATASTSGNRILTVPNALSLARLLCIPVFLWLLFVVESRVAAALLLGALAATDWVDGYIARHFNQVSELGKVLDPAADRIVFIVCVGAIIIDGSAPLWFSLLVVAREVIVGAAMLILTAMGMERFDVSWFGKAGTFCLLFAFPLFLLGSAGDGWFYGVITFSAWGWGLPGLVFSYYSAITYIPMMRRSLAAGRARA